MAAIGWIRLEDHFLVFSDRKGLKASKEGDICGLKDRSGLKVAANKSGLAIAESSWEGNPAGILEKALDQSKTLEEACYKYIKLFQSRGEGKANVIVCSRERGVNLELFGHRFSVAQNEWKLARTEHFEIFADLNKDPAKSLKRLEEVNMLMSRVRSAKDLKDFAVIEVDQDKVNLFTSGKSKGTTYNLIKM